MIRRQSAIAIDQPGPDPVRLETAIKRPTLGCLGKPFLLDAAYQENIATVTTVPRVMKGPKAIVRWGFRRTALTATAQAASANAMNTPQ